MKKVLFIIDATIVFLLGVLSILLNYTGHDILSIILFVVCMLGGYYVMNNFTDNDIPKIKIRIE